MAAPTKSDTPPRWELSGSSLPDDIALNIASFLEASDVCSLGSCSRFWCGVCASDCLWSDLAKRRWPAIEIGQSSAAAADDGGNLSSPIQGWRDFYISKHKQLSCSVSMVTKFVEECTQNGSLEVGYYLKAVDDLHSIGLGFKDVQLFLLARRHSVLLNLIGLHYSLFCLKISPNDAMEALRNCEVSERQVCVSWFKLGRWFYGFRLPDENRSRKVSLGDLAMAKEEEVLGVLNRGTVHEVLRVQITSVSATSWVFETK